MPNSSRFGIGLASAIVANLSGLSLVAAEEFAFYHENVLGTSLALHVRCDNEAAVAGRGARARRDRPARRHFQRLRSGQRVFPLASGSERSVPGLKGAIRGVAGERDLES